VGVPLVAVSVVDVAVVLPLVGVVPPGDVVPPKVVVPPVGPDWVVPVPVVPLDVGVDVRPPVVVCLPPIGPPPALPPWDPRPACDVVWRCAELSVPPGGPFDPAVVVAPEPVVVAVPGPVAVPDGVEVCVEGVVRPGSVPFAPSPVPFVVCSVGP